MFAMTVLSLIQIQIEESETDVYMLKIFAHYCHLYCYKYNMTLHVITFWVKLKDVKNSYLNTFLVQLFHILAVSNSSREENCPYLYEREP